MADRQARRAAGEAAVGDQRAGLSQALRLDVARRVEHFLHARPAARAFVADDDDVAGDDLAGENAARRVVLALEHFRRPLERQHAGVDACRFDDAAVEREVALQHREAAVLRIGVVEVADDALLAILVERLPARRLAERDLGRHAARRGGEELARRLRRAALDVPARQRLIERLGVDHLDVAIEQMGAVELAENAHDAAGAMDVLDVHVGYRRRDLAQHRHAARQAVDVDHGEIELRLVGGGEQMQHGVGRAAHGDVEAHRVLERLEAGDRARQHALVVLLVIALGEVDDQMAGLDEQLLAVGVGGDDRAVAGQRQAERLGQAVHRIGGEHARARAAGRTGRALDAATSSSLTLLVGGGDHRVDQVDARRLALEHDLARLHRPARDEHRGDVEAQRRHQHARGDLVAIADAHHRVGAMGVDHVLDAVGDDLAARQRIEHAVVAHRDAVVDGDGVELLGDAARRLDLARDQLAEILQVDVAGHELGEGIDHRDDRLAEVAVLHAGGAPKSARAGHVAAVRGGAGAQSGHGRSPLG